MRAPTRLLLSIFVNVLFVISLSFASTINNQLATPDQKLLSPVSPFPGTVIIKEIAFKESDRDYLIFSVDGPEERINLKDLQFYDDKNFKIISTDFWVKTGSEVTLWFNEKTADDATSGKLYTEKNGLTSTTEQLLIHKDSEPLAFVCWYKTPIAKNEITDFEKIYPASQWDNPDLESCVPSEDIKNNQALQKTTNENNSDGWEIKNDTNGEGKSVEDETGSPNPTSTSAKKSTQDDLEALINENTNTSPDQEILLAISEIYPAPTAKDQSEWIELINEDTTPIDLGNWIIDDGEGGSKPKRLQNMTVQPGLPFVIELKPYKINLNNDQDSIRLFLPDGTQILEQDYDSVKKGHSYSLITTDGSNEWQWTDQPTPGTVPSPLSTISGTITLPAQFTDPYFFALTDPDDQKYLVTFTEDIIKAPLAKELFVEEQAVKCTGAIEPAPPNANNYQSILKLHSYDLHAAPPQNLNWSLLMIAVTIPLLALGGFIYFKKQKSWNPSISDNY